MQAWLTATGLRPSQPGRTWLDPRDAHLWLALAAALPVWTGLALWPGTPITTTRLNTGALAWLVFVLWQPWAEEMLFRGVLQGALLDKVWARRRWPRRIRHGDSDDDRRHKAGIPAPTLANILATTAFCLAHLATQPAAWAIAVALPSLVFGHLRERQGSIWAPWLVHALYNLGFLLATAR